MSYRLDLFIYTPKNAEKNYKLLFQLENWRRIWSPLPHWLLLTMFSFSGCGIPNQTHSDISFRNFVILIGVT